MTWCRSVKQFLAPCATIRGSMPVGSVAGIVLTVCLILNFLAAILLSIFSIYIDNRPEGTDRKQLRVHYDRERPPPNS